MLDKFTLNKFIYLFKIGCLTEKPFSTIKNIIIIIFADFFKFKIKYLATLNKSKFYYTYKPYVRMPFFMSLNDSLLIMFLVFSFSGV